MREKTKELSGLKKEYTKQMKVAIHELNESIAPHKEAIRTLQREKYEVLRTQSWFLSYSQKKKALRTQFTNFCKQNQYRP